MAWAECRCGPRVCSAHPASLFPPYCSWREIKRLPTSASPRYTCPCAESLTTEHKGLQTRWGARAPLGTPLCSFLLCFVSLQQNTRLIELHRSHVRNITFTNHLYRDTLLSLHCKQKDRQMCPFLQMLTACRNNGFIREVLSVNLHSYVYM